jgi:hypothetical protein
MSLLKNILKRMGLGTEEIILPSGFSSKKMASRLGGDERIGEKFYTGRTSPLSKNENISTPFEADLVPISNNKIGTYWEPVNNTIPNEFVNINPNSKRNALLASLGVAGTGTGIAGYIAGIPSEEDKKNITRNFLAEKYLQQSGFY